MQLSLFQPPKATKHWASLANLTVLKSLPAQCARPSIACASGRPGLRLVAELTWARDYQARLRKTRLPLPPRSISLTLSSLNAPCLGETTRQERRMLRVLGSPKKLCNGLTRRDMLV